MSFYKEHYDVVIVGCALAGMAAALQLQQKGVKDILILEKNNMPGGVATDFVRNGFEIEASLHEMMSIGPKDKRMVVGAWFDEVGVAAQRPEDQDPDPVKTRRIKRRCLIPRRRLFNLEFIDECGVWSVECGVDVSADSPLCTRGLYAQGIPNF